jgi:hypothetical protein
MRADSLHASKCGLLNKFRIAHSFNDKPKPLRLPIFQLTISHEKKQEMRNRKMRVSGAAAHPHFAFQTKAVV